MVDQYPKIVAQQGMQRFLVQTSESMARVLDTDQGRYFPETLMQSVLARGYWQPYSGKQKLDDLLTKVR
jgi:hypothetical protein